MAVMAVLARPEIMAAMVCRVCLQLLRATPIAWHLPVALAAGAAGAAAAARAAKGAARGAAARAEQAAAEVVGYLTTGFLSVAPRLLTLGVAEEAMAVLAAQAETVEMAARQAKGVVAAQAEMGAA